jgi:hypothetical protein
MQIPVMIEPVTGNGYRAVGAGVGTLSAEGPTAEDALQRFRELLAARLAAGLRVVTVEVPDAGNAWPKLAGMYKDDPLFEEWRKAMAAYRLQVEDDPDYL